MRKIPTDITKEKFFELYCSKKMSVREIGLLVKKSPRQVSRYLGKFQIKTRPFSTKGLAVRLGAKLSKESKDKIRQKAIGRKVPIEVRRRMGSKGNKNPGYIDGRTPEHKRQRRTIEYKLWREAVFKRDNYTCQMCGKHGGDINADHIKSFAQFPEFRTSIENGRTLCIPCHRKTDTFGNGSKAKKQH